MGTVHRVGWAVGVVCTAAMLFAFQVQARENTALTIKQRAEIVRQIVLRHGPELHRQGIDVRAWAVKLGRTAAKADAANLSDAAAMPNPQTMMAVLAGQPVNSPSIQRAVRSAYSKSGAKALGSSISDTVYTPLPNGRCRVADSRVITSPIPPATDRAIDTEEVVSYASQGGSGSSAGDGSTNCGIPSFATAFAVSVTVLPIADDGFFKIFANGTDRTRGNTVLYNAGTFGAASDVIVISCQACAEELTVWSSTSVNYVIDVIGYFMPPEATALQCDPVSTNTQVASGNNFTLNAPACATGYTLTGVGCRSNGFREVEWANTGLILGGGGAEGQCRGTNTSGNQAVVTATSQCCRVPGR